MAINVLAVLFGSLLFDTFLVDNSKAQQCFITTAIGAVTVMHALLSNKKYSKQICLFAGNACQ